MKKGRIIDTNKLILRILITFLGTAGVSSVFVTVTENYAGLGLVMMVSALFSVLDICRFKMAQIRCIACTCRYIWHYQYKEYL